MQVASKAKKRIAVVAAACALAIAATGCIPDNQGPVGPADAAKNTMFQDLNAQRRAHGLPELGYSPRLDLDAHIWASVMGQQKRLYHQDLNFLLNNAEHRAYWTLGENISVGPFYMNPHDVTKMFMGSPPHRANILNRNFNVVGIGTAYTNGGLWVSVLFGGL